MTSNIRKRVARSIAEVDFLREQHNGYIGRNFTFCDDWIFSGHYEMADAAIAEMTNQDKDKNTEE